MNYHQNVHFKRFALFYSLRSITTLFSIYSAFFDGVTVMDFVFLLLSLPFPTCVLQKSISFEYYY